MIVELLLEVGGIQTGVLTWEPTAGLALIGSSPE